MTKQQKAMAILIRDGGWVPTYTFCSEHCGLFIGHRGAARISEVANDSLLKRAVETDDSERTYKYRFRFSDTAEFLPLLTPKWRVFIEDELKHCGAKYEVYKNVPVETGKNSVKLVRQKVTVQ